MTRPAISDKRQSEIAIGEEHASDGVNASSSKPRTPRLLSLIGDGPLVRQEKGLRQTVSNIGYWL
jgi:hypothetical protein